MLNRCETIIREEEDKTLEEDHLKHALGVCCCPAWSFKKVADKQRNENGKCTKSSKNQYNEQVVTPYIEDLSEKVDRVLKKHHIVTAMQPFLHT